MRYLFIVFLLSSLSSFAQDPFYVPMKSNYLFKGIKMDSLFILPVLDTASARKVNGNLVRQSDAYYWYDSTRWVALVTGGGGSTDTTSLSNRINTKVPYTGAVADVDLGTFNLSAHELKVTGTGGAGKLDLRKQSSNSTTTANSSALYSDATGNLGWQNDNIRYFKLTNNHFTADHSFRLPDTTGTLALLENVDTRLKISDTAAMLGGYLREADTASLSNRIDLKLNISDTANMLAGYLREADTASLSNRINLKLNISDTSAMLANYLTGADTVSLSNRINAITPIDTTSLSNRINTKLNISDTASMLTNYQRTSSFPISAFGGGSGVAGDTSVFTTSAIYGAFYNDGVDTIILTGYRAIVQGASASITPTIYWNDTLSTTVATKAVNSPSAVTSTTTGNNVTSLDNTNIPPGNWVWVQTGTVTTKPTFFSLTLFGYRKR